jgi:hypothetical protein
MEDDQSALDKRALELTGLVQREEEARQLHPNHRHQIERIIRQALNVVSVPHAAENRRFAHILAQYLYMLEMSCQEDPFTERTWGVGTCSYVVASTITACFHRPEESIGFTLLETINMIRRATR